MVVCKDLVQLQNFLLLHPLKCHTTYFLTKKKKHNFNIFLLQVVTLTFFLGTSHNSNISYKFIHNRLILPRSPLLLKKAQNQSLREVATNKINNDFISGYNSIRHLNPNPISLLPHAHFPQPNNSIQNPNPQQNPPTRTKPPPEPSITPPKPGPVHCT